MDHQLSDADAAYLSAFESFALQPSEFHHRDHLRVAYALVCRYGADAAFERIRVGINGWLEHLGVGTAKYHHTLTSAWIRLVAQRMSCTERARDFEAFLAANPDLLEQSAIHRYYSPALLDSAEARADLLEPDLAPFASWPGAG